MTDYSDGEDLHEWAKDTAKALLLIALAAVLLTLLTLTGCGGVKIPPEVLDCRTWGCPPGQECRETGKPANLVAWACRPAPEPTPEPTPAPDPSPTPEPTPTRAPECVLAGSPSVPVAGHRNTRGETVNEAMRQLSGYSGGRVVLEMGRQEWQALVAAELRARGLCAGQHTPATDEIAVARVDSDPWEGFHVYADNPSRPGTGTVVWSIGETEASGGAYRGAWYPPAATPAVACPAPRWEAFRDPADDASCRFVWGLKAGARWRDSDGGLVEGWDATLNVERCCAYCAAIRLPTMPGGVGVRCRCPLRAEGNPERLACEAEVGAVWQTDGVAIVNPGNPAQATCSSCSWLRVCTKSGTCSEKVAP